jgi:putative glutamine amidotransferase
VRPRPVILVIPSLQQRGVEFADFSVSLSAHYTDAVLAAGGLPVIAPCTTDRGAVAELVSRADGVMLTGGDDAEPSLYRDTPLPAEIDAALARDEPQRDLLELEVIRAVFASGRPLLAICRGVQVLNLALGGDLVWDIPQEVPGALRHKQMDRKNEPVHDVALTPGSLFSSVAKTDVLSVNSTHHQALGRVSGLLQVVARSADGVVEAVEAAPGHRHLCPWLIGVQFHPERLTRDRQPAFRELFKAFVRACGKPKQ